MFSGIVQHDFTAQWHIAARETPRLWATPSWEPVLMVQKIPDGRGQGLRMSVLRGYVLRGYADVFDADVSVLRGYMSVLRGYVTCLF